MLILNNDILFVFAIYHYVMLVCYSITLCCRNQISLYSTLQWM